MKKTFIPLLLLLTLMLGACTAAPAEPTQPSSGETSAEGVIPQDLLGTWSSAHDGELRVTETFTVYEDGAVYATVKRDGENAGAVNGTYYTVGGTLYCHIDSGTEQPYDLEYTFRIDGRELYLTDSDGTSQFLRVS